MDGGVWQRLLHFGVMHTAPVLHAVAKSGLIRVDGAMERRLSALAKWRLPWWLGSHLPAGRVGNCRAGWGRFISDGWRLPCCILRDAHGTILPG